MISEIKSGEERIQRFTKKLGNLNSIETFDKDLEAAKASVNDIRDELQVKEANKHTFKQFIDKMEKSLKSPGDSCCPTCNRSFGTESECEEVINALKEEIEKVPQKVNFLSITFNFCYVSILCLIISLFRKTKVGMKNLIPFLLCLELKKMILFNWNCNQYRRYWKIIIFISQILFFSISS